MKNKNIIQDLEWRGQLKQYTNLEKVIWSQINNKGAYCGFDPSGDSLHVGHLIQIVLLKRLGKMGFKPIALIGGATGLIGDPSGKVEERSLLDDTVVIKNTNMLSQQIKKLIPEVTVLNNLDWFKKIDSISFLRDIGKYFNISYLLAKETIAKRVSSGLSYTEFSYNLLQAYDFLELYRNNDCYLQVGGSDQWGNITSGIDLIKKILGENSNSCGITMNLLLQKNGKKFGKTEEGAIWLSSEKTHPYNFYQFFLNQGDDEAQMLLKYLTFINENDFSNLHKDHYNNPKEKILQKYLAKEMMLFVHSKEDYEKASRASNAIFSNNYGQLQISEWEFIANVLDNIIFEKDKTLIELLVMNKICNSKREAREMIVNRAITFNGVKKINDVDYIVTDKDFLFNKYLVIKKGKRNNFLLVKNDKRS